MRFYQYFSFTIKFPSKWTQRVPRNGIPDENTLSHLNPAPAHTYGSLSFFTCTQYFRFYLFLSWNFFNKSNSPSSQMTYLSKHMFMKGECDNDNVENEGTNRRIWPSNCLTNCLSRLLLPKSLFPSFLKNLTDPRMYQNGFQLSRTAQQVTLP